MADIQWIHFSPRGSGGSFGRADMGEFCEINSVLFGLPLFETSISRIKKSDLETRIQERLKSAKPGDIFEWSNDDFTSDLSVDWPKKLRESVASY